MNKASPPVCKNGHSQIEINLSVFNGYARCRLCAKEAAARRRSNKGVVSRKEHRDIVAANVPAIIDRYVSNPDITAAQVAREFKTSNVIVLNALNAAGVVRDPRKPMAHRTHCKRGHALTGDNIYYQRTTPCCRACHAISGERWRRSQGYQCQLELNERRRQQRPDLVQAYQNKEGDTVSLGKKFGRSNRAVASVLREAGVLLKPGETHLKARIVDGCKECARCGLWKPILTFGRKPASSDRAEGRATCKQCLNEIAIERSRLKKYGVSPAKYDALLREQNGVCAICKHPETRVLPSGVISRSLAVDHDHGSLHVRGLLCARCNQALGLLRDDATLVLQAHHYLLRGQTRQV